MVVANASIDIESNSKRHPSLEMTMSRKQEGVSLSRVICPRKRDSTSMASEYLVLTEIASNLSTYVSSHQSQQPLSKKLELPKKILSSHEFSRHRQGSQENINEDAKLLLTLKRVISQSDEHTTDIDVGFADTISPSLSFEAKRYFETTKYQGKEIRTNFHGCAPIHIRDYSISQQCDSDRNFSFTCPSLSLLEDEKHPFARAMKVFKPTSSPSQLFSRPIQKQLNVNVSSVAETLASNVMQSFMTALNWRNKVWTKDLSRTASLKFKQELAKLESRIRSSSSSQKRPKNGKLDVEALKEKFKKSQEARVIKALSQSRSSIHVHDVRTTFFVLEEQKENNCTIPIEKEKKDDDTSNQSFGQSQVFRPLKKRKTMMDTKVVPSKYTLSHALNLESRCSVSTSSEKKVTVSLQTPGVIHGTFIRNEDGEAMLVDVSISLDTQNLALSIEKKSRLVVRSAAEECIISPPYSAPSPVQQHASRTISIDKPSDKSIDSSKGAPRQPDTTNKYNPFSPKSSYTSTYSGYGDNALVTPNEREYVSSDSDEMPPPPPRLPMEGNGSFERKPTSFLNPRRVSPHEFSKTLLSPTMEKDSISPPLVSPYLNPNVLNNKTTTKSTLDCNGPSLPALVELACAVHTLCN